MAAFGALLIMTAVRAGTSSISASSASAKDAVADDASRSAVGSILGASGKLRALIGLPATLTQDPAIGPLLSDLPITVPGVYSLGLAAPDGDSLVAVALEAFPPTNGTTLAGYRTGRWPSTGLAARESSYSPPAGFIPVTPENESTSVSKRFRLCDFLTHDQQNVWPKVLVLRTVLVDKLELIGDALDRRALPSRLCIMSGFRTPQYNALGVGDKGGRAATSRHMYGDAADVFVDADGDGRMDDLNGDGLITVDDAKVLLAVAEAVEDSHPELVGGLSAYPANGVHGPFVHVDARGMRARW